MDDINLESILKELDEMFHDSKEKAEAARKQWAEEHPLQASCNHGVTFDEVEAQKILDEAKSYGTGDPSLDFILGSPSAPYIRKRWPRLDGECPKGCGYKGIYYASMSHYIMGDW